MADIPQDPRQLARDILSGKVSIEDLAREQARRRGGQAGGGNQPAPPPPPPRQAEVRRPLPPQQVRKQQRPVARPQQQQRPTYTPPPPKPPVIRHQEPVNQAYAIREAPVAPVAPEPEQTQGEVATVKRAKPTALKKLLGGRKAARQAIILAEILNKPLAMREE